MNNAGIVNRGLAWELSLEDWRRVLDVDVWGVIHGVRSFVPRMLSSGDDGHVVNTQYVIDAIRRNRPYVYSDRDGHGAMEDRFARILSARDDVIDGQE